MTFPTCFLGLVFCSVLGFIVFTSNERLTFSCIRICVLIITILGSLTTTLLMVFALFTPLRIEAEQSVDVQELKNEIHAAEIEGKLFNLNRVFFPFEVNKDSNVKFIIYDDGPYFGVFYFEKGLYGLKLESEDLIRPIKLKEQI